MTNTFLTVKSFLTAASLLISMPLAAWASEANVMPSFQYDEMAAKLISVGYSGLRVIDADKGKIQAFDAQGSEVVLTVDVGTRRLVKIAHVHSSDL